MQDNGMVSALRSAYATVTGDYVLLLAQGPLASSLYTSGGHPQQSGCPQETCTVAETMTSVSIDEPNKKTGVIAFSLPEKLCGQSAWIQFAYGSGGYDRATIGTITVHYKHNTQTCLL